MFRLSIARSRGPLTILCLLALQLPAAGQARWWRGGQQPTQQQLQPPQPPAQQQLRQAQQRQQLAQQRWRQQASQVAQAGHDEPLSGVPQDDIRAADFRPADDATGCQQASCLDGCVCGDPCGCGGSGCGLCRQDDFLGLSHFKLMDCTELFGGVEYLHVRPSVSDPWAFVRIDGRGSADARETFVPYDFHREGSVRAFIGLRFCNCCSDIRFTYTDFSSDTTATAPTGLPLDSIVLGHGEVIPLTGEQLFSTYDIAHRTYDIDYHKTHCLSCNGDCCGGCCLNPCNAQGCCPPCGRWELTWGVGVRIVDSGWTAGSRAVDTGGTTTTQTFEEMTFTGAGPRLGVQLRRYFGRSDLLALYARGSIALILGDYELEATRFQRAGNVTRQRHTGVRIIPNTDIEVGGDVKLGCHAKLAAGYLFSVWHDLGQPEQIAPELGLNMDDANILAFDGLFIRGEFAY